MKVKEMAKIVGGRILSGDPEADIDLSRVSTDSRLIKSGEFFIALSGPNFCGSDYLQEVMNKGAIGAIVERAPASLCSTKSIVIKVKDATKALQDIARSHRASFNIPVICVTGSNGKTTVKEMIAAVLSTRYNVLKNEGTKNNHIGVPQTLLKLKKGHDICVLELGTNHKGEIRALAAIARPTMAVLTNVGASHLEFLKDLQGVYKEKRQLVDSLGKSGIAVINGDDNFLRLIRGRKPRIIRYGLGKSNDVRGTAVTVEKNRLAFTVNGRTHCELKMLGSHNAYNALAAIAAASCFKVSCSAARRALLRFKPACMRLNQLNINGISVINDSYNSNPLSMKTALEAIGACPARAKWVVFGDMLELGAQAGRFHEMAGELIARSDASGLLTFGDLSRQTLSGASASGMHKDNLWHCQTHDEIVKILQRIARSGDIVLVKGSRSMKMEKVIEKLKG